MDIKCETRIKSCFDEIGKVDNYDIINENLIIAYFDDKVSLIIFEDDNYKCVDYDEIIFCDDKKKSFYNYGGTFKYFMALKNGSKYIIDDTGKKIIKASALDEILFLNEYFCVKNNKNIELYDLSGYLISYFILDLDDIYDYNDNVAIVKKDDNYFNIDETGNILTNKYSKIECINDDLYILEKNNKKRILINKNVEKIKNLKPKESVLNIKFGDNVILKKDNHYIIYFLDGSSKRYDSVYKLNDDFVVARKANINYVIDIYGKKIEKIPNEYIWDFTEDYYLIGNNNKMGIIDKSFNKELDMDYDIIFKDELNNIYAIKKDQLYIVSLPNLYGPYICDYDISKLRSNENKYIPLKLYEKGNKYILYDLENKKEIHTENYEEIEYLKDNMAKYKSNDKDLYGLYDIKSSKYVTDRNYSYISDFKNNLAIATKKEGNNLKYGIIDKKGNIVIPFEFKKIIMAISGVYIVDNILVNINKFKLSYDIDLYDKGKYLYTKCSDSKEERKKSITYLNAQNRLYEESLKKYFDKDNIKTKGSTKKMTKK